MATPTTTGVEGQEAQMDMVVQVKELLTEPRYRISLHDLVVKELMKVIESVTDDSFAVQGQSCSSGEFAERLTRYEFQRTYDVL